MAGLLPPTVGERLAACGIFVEVWGVMPGADVDLDVDGVQITQTVAGTAATFKVAPLIEGQLIAARQRLGPNSSNWSNQVKVENVILPPPPPRTEPAIHRCSHCMGVWGMAPGSQVEVLQGGVVVANGDAGRAGSAWLPLRDPPAPRVDAQAITCGQVGAPTSTATYATEGMLPTPVVVPPIFECQTIVGLQGLIPGAEVEIFVTDLGGTKNTIGRICTIWRAVNVYTGYAMKSGDRVSARQTMIDPRWQCNQVSLESAQVAAEPPDKRIKPVIQEPLYEGGSQILVTNQVEGATITLLSRPTAAAPEQDLGSRPASQYPEVPTDTLQAGQVLRVAQELCGVREISDPVTVLGWPGRLDPPRVRVPLYACAELVAVDDVLPGAKVYVETTDPNAPPSPTPVRYAIGQAWSPGASVIVPVAPALLDRAFITAYQEVGGKTSGLSHPEQVKSARRLAPPSIVRPVRVGDTAVWVSGILPGAYVRVFDGPLQIGGAATLKTTDAIPVATIVRGAIIRASQLLCAESELSAPEPAQVEAFCGGAPAYNPAAWNDGGQVQGCNNCYNYACDIRTDNFAQPGGGTNLDCAAVTGGAVKDGLRRCAAAELCHPCHHRVALVMAPGVDYHWFRLDNTGRWSHKPGCGAARDLDSSGNPITDPSQADFSPYTEFCGFFCVYKPDVHIAGPYCNCPP